MPSSFGDRYEAAKASQHFWPPHVSMNFPAGAVTESDQRGFLDSLYGATHPRSQEGGNSVPAWPIRGASASAAVWIFAKLRHLAHLAGSGVRIGISNGTRSPRPVKMIQSPRSSDLQARRMRPEALRWHPARDACIIARNMVAAEARRAVHPGDQGGWIITGDIYGKATPAQRRSEVRAACTKRAANWTRPWRSAHRSQEHQKQIRCSPA